MQLHARRMLGLVAIFLLTLFWLGAPSIGMGASAVATAGTEPLFDLAAAIRAAKMGETVLVPAGIYAGPIHIDKSIRLEGEGFPVIEGTGKGDVITISAPDVSLRGFVVRGSGASLDQENAGITVTAAGARIEDNRLEDVLFGIYLKQAPYSTVRGNEIVGKALDVARRGDAIRAWYSENCRVEGNHVRAGRDVIIWFSSGCTIRNNIVQDGRYGLHFMFSDDQIVENNSLHGNSVGAFLMYGRNLILQHNLIYANRGPSGYGVGLKDMDDVNVFGNRIVANRIGVYNDNSPREPDARLELERNVIAYNDTGITLLPLVKHNLYTKNLFIDNGAQVAVMGSGELRDNAWSENDRGNYWSDYVGFDADGDGIGDVPYRTYSLFEDLLASFPELRLFSLSPASAALDFAAQAFPVFRPEPVLTDPKPLLAPPTIPATPMPPQAPATRTWAVAAVLLILTSLIVTYGMRLPGRPV